MKLVRTLKDEYGVVVRDYVCNDCRCWSSEHDTREVNEKYRRVIRKMPPTNRRRHEKWLHEEKVRLDKQEKQTKTKEKKHVKRNQGK